MAAQIRRLPSRYSITMTIVLALIAMFMVNASFSKAAENSPAANKVAAAGSDIDSIQAGGTELIMSEVMKVSTTRDLMLHLSAECSILTRLNTQGGPNTSSESDFAFGQVKLYINIDGKRVAVSDDDVAVSGTPEKEDEDYGKVVFCNRAYQRTVTDNEGNDPKDGIDGESDYIRTRTANAFTWLALDAGRTYDDPSNGNNVIQVDVFAEYSTNSSESAVSDPATEPTGPVTCARTGPEDQPLASSAVTCADAFVGSRTLVVDTDVAANDETIQPVDPTNKGYVRGS